VDQPCPVDTKALTELAKTDWTEFSGRLEDVRVASRGLGWLERPMRPGTGTVAELRPVSQKAAHPNSLSAKVGFGEQPLHTDGAHMQCPPDVIVLASRAPTAAATRLWSANEAGIPWDALRHGVFTVSTGQTRFFSVIFEAGRLRFDPGCMTPCDQRAREAVAFFDSAWAGAERHQWRTGTEVLVINNRRALHARESVGPLELDRVIDRVAFWIPAER